MIKPVIYILILLCHTLVSQAQTDTLAQKVYQVNLCYELPASAICIGASYFGFRELDKYSTITAAQVTALNPAHINSFDRPVAFKDPSSFAHAQKQSDLFLNIAVVSPIVLALDKRIRKDWLDLVAMYMITHAADNAVYFAASFSIRRPRPLTYNPGLPTEAKTGDARTNSFFSGHTSFSATSTFFAAKVYTDYHHIKGVKRLLFYTAASIPPALVGYYRMEAGKHFKTDVAMGFLVGAASGILIPELHRKLKQHKNISVAPLYFNGYSGLCVNVGF